MCIDIQILGRVHRFIADAGKGLPIEILSESGFVSLA